MIASEMILSMYFSSLPTKLNQQQSNLIILGVNR